MKLKIVASLMLAAAVAGCSTSGGGSAAIQGMGGSSYVQETPPVAGVSGGGLVRNLTGDRLGRAEQVLALEAEYRTLESTPGGQRVPWRGRDADTFGEVVAAQPYRVGSQDCRQYAHTVTVDGQQFTGRGTACRNPDGSWTPLI